MRRRIRSAKDRPPALVEPPVRLPARVYLPLDRALNRCSLTGMVTDGAAVVAGQAVACCDVLTLHAPAAGVVQGATPHGIAIRCSDTTEPPVFPSVTIPSARELPAFAADMGLAGMGGSMFPASIKLQAGRRIHTLVVDAVECEPGIEIDEALLVHDGATVGAGMRVLTQALGIRKSVLAVKRASVSHLGHCLDGCGMDVETLAMSNFYPAGAEKLIVGRLLGGTPPAGTLPVHLGVLVFSVASLWAIGRRIREGRPCIDRPLTLVGPDGKARNLVVPVGAPVRHVLDECSVDYDDARHVLVAGGLMMGHGIAPDDSIVKGTNAIFVLPARRRLSKPEEPCILCGSCFDACPLKLHPIGMAERIRARRFSGALEAHVNECFLCGNCSAVCPSEIPLVQVFHEGKQWLRQQT